MSAERIRNKISGLRSMVRRTLCGTEAAAEDQQTGGLAFEGTPESIADDMEAWIDGGACDGFNIMFPWLPGGLDEFVTRVIPELQRRGRFRMDYEGTTLREHLGLQMPKNRFF